MTMVASKAYASNQMEPKNGSGSKRKGTKMTSTNNQAAPRSKPVFYAAHFNVIADVIAQLPSDNLRVLVARAFADEFAKDNPHFKRTRFMSACRVKM